MGNWSMFLSEGHAAAVIEREIIEGSAFVDAYVREWRLLGRLQFRMNYTSPVIIGLGVAGELVEQGPGTPRDATLKTIAVSDSHEDLLETESLAGRIWAIRATSRSGDPAIRVGRSAENDIVIPEYSLSRVHCCFKWGFGGQLTIYDLGSTNGTWIDHGRLNDKRGQKLKGEEELVLGRYRFRFLANKAFIDYVNGYSQSRSSAP
jgi:hypothetical protein